MNAPEHQFSPSTRGTVPASISMSAEQMVLTSFVSRNPWAGLRVRQRAEALQLLHDQVKAGEIAGKTGLSSKAVRRLASRFNQGGLCTALLGNAASRERRVWLLLCPSRPPLVKLSQDKNPHRIDTK